MNLETIQALTALGLVGSIAVGASDIAGMGQTRHMPRYWNEPWLYFSGISRNRILFCMAGTLALPIAALGYFGVYSALRPSGTLPALLAVLPMAFFMLAGCAVHALITVLGDLADFCADPGHTVDAQASLAGFKTRLIELFRVIARPALAAYGLGSLIFTALILFGETMYPRWFALVNPFLLTLALRRAFVHLPPNPFGLIRPSVVHLVHAPLLALTLLYLQQA